MRFLIENPPFGTPWSGKDAKAGQEDAVYSEYTKRFNGRWGAGLPSGGDSQLLFLQSAVAKLDDTQGRAAIIENGSPLFTGGTASGESQVRRWLLENDLIEAIIQMPTELFYNTGISTYVWILSKNKRTERAGMIQLIDASGICHKLRKPLGNKKNEFSPEDRKKITELYANFKENEYSKIYDNTEFIYKEYTVMQPLQRSYSITDDSIQAMLRQGTLRNLWDEVKVAELEELGTAITGKEQKTLDNYSKNKPMYDAILDVLQSAVSNQKWLSPDEFMPVITKLLSDVVDNKTIQKIADGLSVMNKDAVIQKDKKGNIIFDKSTKDTEIVKIEEDIDSYMKREVLPHVPDAVAFWEENLEAKNPVIRTGAEIPFTQYFYKYQQPIPSEELEVRFIDLELSISERVDKLFGGE